MFETFGTFNFGSLQFFLSLVVIIIIIIVFSFFFFVFVFFMVVGKQHFGALLPPTGMECGLELLFYPSKVKKNSGNAG